MVLHIQSDASYLTRSDSRSVAGGIHYLSNDRDDADINGAILAISNIIPNVVASAAEAEYAAVFMNAQHGVWLRTILEALGYHQPATRMACDNQCAVGLANNSIRARRSKSIDMRYHWVRDRVSQGQFKIAWSPGKNNLADFFTKALPVHRHRELTPILVHDPMDATAAAITYLGKQARRFAAYMVSRRLPAASSGNPHYPMQIERVC
jgi:hypothetical protein